VYNSILINVAQPRNMASRSDLNIRNSGVTTYILQRVSSIFSSNAQSHMSAIL